MRGCARNALTNTSSFRSTMRGGIKKWRVEYNRERPQSSLANLTPEEFAAKNQMSSAIARTVWPPADLNWPAWRNALGPRIQNSTVFRPLGSV